MNKKTEDRLIKELLKEEAERIRDEWESIGLVSNISPEEMGADCKSAIKKALRKGYEEGKKETRK